PPPRRALDRGERHRPGDLRRQGTAAHREPVHLYSPRGRPPPGEPRQGGAAHHRGAERCLPRRGRHRPLRRRLRPDHPLMAGEPARNPRVLHVYRTYFPDTQGGGEELIRQICRNTRGMGIDSRVFTLSPAPAPAPIQRDEALVIQARRHLEIASCGISLSALPAFRAEAARADVLHYHFPWPFGDALHLLGGSATRNKPTVVSHLSDVVRQRGLMALYQPLMRRFLARADHIVATSPNYAASSPLLAAYQDKLRIIPIGLDDGQLPAVTPAQLEAVRERHGEDFLLFVGVFRYYKGLHVLLEAARDTRANIVIAGTGPEEAALRAFARQHKLANVRF